MTTTWQTIATDRGFTDLGNRTWTAPNGQTVAEGFVAAYCRPEYVAAERRIFTKGLDTATQRAHGNHQPKDPSPTERGSSAHMPSA